MGLGLQDSCLEIRLRIPRRNRREFFQTLEELPPPAGEEGCLERSLYQRLDDPRRILWLERWRERAALDAYLASDRFHALLGAAKVLGEVVALRLLESIPSESFEPRRER